MKRLNNNSIKYQLILTFLFLAQFVQAQPIFDDDTVDVPAAPVDDWVLPMFLVGIIIVVYFINKKAQQSKGA